MALIVLYGLIWFGLNVLLNSGYKEEDGLEDRAQLFIFFVQGLRYHFCLGLDKVVNNIL